MTRRSYFPGAAFFVCSTFFRPVRLARSEDPEAPIVRAEKAEALQQHALG